MLHGMNSCPRFLAVLLCVCGFFLSAAESFAQRAIQSPLVVNVLRTRSTGGSQQMALKVTVRNMSKKDVEVRLEGLFVAAGGMRNGQDGIYCQLKEEAVLKPSESKEFELESEPPSSGYYTYNGVYYYYSSMKVRGYMTRVFADGQLVNVTGSTPSFQKAGWEPKELAKLGYSNGEAPPARPSSVVTTTVTRSPTAPTAEPATEPAAAPAVTNAKPVALAEPPPPPAPVKSTFDQKTYEEVAQVYNNATDAYQNFLKNRGTPATLRRIENDLKFCVEEIEKISVGAPASLDLPGFLAKCQKTLFAVHGTMQTQP